MSNLQAILIFAGEHPILTFILALLTSAFMHSLFFRLPNRFIRHLNIRKAGWPTHPLMDANGDIVHPKGGDE